MILSLRSPRNFPSPGMIAVIAFAAIAFLFCLSGCATADRCARKFPPQVKDSTNYREEVKDTVKIIQADSSMARYLVDCEQTANGYKARIVQLLTQQPGQFIQTPVATIDGGGILTTTATTPQREIHWQIKRFYFSAVKSQVYVKITNELTWWQKWFTYIGFAAICYAMIRLGLLIFKLYKSSIL